MRIFLVDKNSWHYKLNLKMSKLNKCDKLTDANYSENSVQINNNFCSYCQLTFLNLYTAVLISFFLVLVLCCMSFFIYFLGILVAHNTMFALSIIAVICFCAATNICINCIFDRIYNPKDIDYNETEANIFKAKCSLWKNKACAKVEFKE